MKLSQRMRLKAHRASSALRQTAVYVGRGETRRAVRHVGRTLSAVVGLSPRNGTGPGSPTSDMIQARTRESEAFDRAFSVDTSGVVRVEDMDLDHPDAVFSGNYAPSHPSVFGDMLGHLQGIEHADFTFIDFGSGKGRALLLASEHPFKKIVGLEFAVDLSRIAAENVRTYSSDRQECRNIDTLCVDAASFHLPDQPLVCYFYNPFHSEVMTRILDGLEASLRCSPREVFVLYARVLELGGNDANLAVDLGPLLDARRFLTRIVSATTAGEHYAVYRNDGWRGPTRTRLERDL